MKNQFQSDPEALDRIVFTTLREAGLLPEKLPMFQETRIKMGKIELGKHNQLQALIVQEFGPRFAPGAKLLYLGDTANKALIFDQPNFDKLGILTTEHGKFPDIVLYAEQHNWLYLIEAVTSHGAISPKRHFELERMFEHCSAGRIYVTAFLNFGAFKKFLNEIAWETEVWIAEIPDHLIHFNGDRFLGPRR